MYVCMYVCMYVYIYIYIYVSSPCVCVRARAQRHSFVDTVLFWNALFFSARAALRNPRGLLIAYAEVFVKPAPCCKWPAHWVRVFSWWFNENKKGRYWDVYIYILYSYIMLYILLLQYIIYVWTVNYIYIAITITIIMMMMIRLRISNNSFFLFLNNK